MTTFDILPCLKLCQMLRLDGTALGMVRSLNSEWKSETRDQPRWFWRTAWMTEFHGNELGFETLDYSIIQWSGHPEDEGSFWRRRVNTIDERGYELTGSGWTLRFEYPQYPSMSSRAIAFLGLWGVPCGVRLFGSLDDFQRQMTLIRLGTQIDQWPLLARDPETHNVYQITRYAVELRP